MKIRVLAQNYKNGQLDFLEVPRPVIKPGFLLVRNVASLVSTGTEKAMIELARKSIVGKAIARPDWVTQVKNKVKSEGLGEALRQADGRLPLQVRPDT